MKRREKMRDRILGTLIAGVTIAAGAAFGQTVPATQTAPAAQATPATAMAASNLMFDVASVRPAAQIDTAALVAILRSGRKPESVSVAGTRATFLYMSLNELIAYAYKLPRYEVSGPEWLATDRFDIAARMPDGATSDDVPAMLQALLKERFMLTAHLATREQTVLGLVVAKGGPKLKESTETPEAIDPNAPLKPGETQVDSIDGPERLMRNADGTTTYNMGTRGNFTIKVDGQNGTLEMEASSITMNGFAMMLNSLGGGDGRRVVDLTGIKGNYQAAVDFSLADIVSSLRDQGIDLPTRPRSGPPSAEASDPGGGATVAEALGKLGLKLEKRRANVEQLVVDHMEKMPTKN